MDHYGVTHCDLSSIYCQRRSPMRPDLQHDTLIKTQTAATDSHRRGRLKDGQTAGEGQLMDGQTAGEGRLMDRQTAGEGQLMDGQTAGEGRLMDGQTAGEGRLMDGQTAGEGTDCCNRQPQRKST
ncbi:hypothetical protein ACOMHN_027727 [Nucella lapillus]